MSLRSPTEDEKAAFVMPAWMAGIQARKDASGDVHVDLIPALHAGMTGLTASCLTERNSFTHFSKEARRNLSRKERKVRKEKFKISSETWRP